MDEGADDRNLQLSCEESKEETGQPSFSQVWLLFFTVLFQRSPSFPLSSLNSRDSIPLEQGKYGINRPKEMDLC